MKRSRYGDSWLAFVFTIAAAVLALILVIASHA